MTLIRLDDGREFPAYEGKPLAWSIGLYATWAEEQAGYPRARAVIRAMQEHRPTELAYERRALLRSSLADRVFGHNARKLLAVIESESEVAQ